MASFRTQRLRPAVVLAIAVTIVASFLTLRCIARASLGPVGFNYVITEPNGQIIRGTADYAIAPEVIPSPHPNGSLKITTTYFADREGRYVWNLGSSSSCRLSVDGRELFRPRPGLVRPFEQYLKKGPHAIVIDMPRADLEGAIAFAVRRPGETWRARLVGPADTTTSSPAEVVARFGSHVGAYRAVAALAPYLGVAALIAIGLLSVGRRRALAFYRDAVADVHVHRVLVAIAFVVIVVPMIAPIAEPGFYFCHEGEGYIVRLAEYAAAIRGGVPMGRWWPDPVWGRGYPFLCLYAPLLYIVATPLLWLGLSTITVVKTITAGVVFGGAAAVFALVRRRASRPAALAATALFVYAPYVQTNVWIRADLAECLGFVTFPLALLALDIALDGSPAKHDAPTTTTPRWTAARIGRIAALALTVAALGCSHNITAYFSVYFIATWLLVRCLLRDVTWASIIDAFIGGTLALLLTVFYAIPAIADANRVWIVRVMTGYYDPVRNLLPWSGLLTAAPRWGMRTFLGLPATLTCIAGLVALSVSVLRRKKLPAGVTTSVVQGVVGSTLALALASRPLGYFFIKHVPLANFVQFPFRMFLFAACLAPLAAAAFDLVAPAKARWACSAALIGAIMAAAIPQYGPSAPLVRVHVRERAFLRDLETDYVTSMNEYLPKTVRRTVPRFGDVAHVISGSATLADPARSAGRYSADVDAKTAAIVEFNAHWFPGWVAEVDGGAVSVGPAGAAPIDDGGLIRVKVLPGRHHIELRFERTRAQWVCDLISLVVLLGVAFAAVYAWLMQRRDRLLLAQEPGAKNPRD